jgi:hypothetical protein
MPLMVTVYVPVGVVALVVTERVEDTVAGFGVKLPLAPLGSPLALSVTWPVKPPVGLIVTP